MCISVTTLSSIGLGFDIVGVTLLLFFWVPPQTAFKGQVATNEEEYPEPERKKLVLMKIAARSGYGFMLFGFVLQLVSNYIA